MFEVHQPWDPLKVCVVGRSYPPEFYSWITVPRVRELFEKIAQETEEDYQSLIAKLDEFGVQVVRPDIDIDAILTGPTPYAPPPMCPRDNMITVGSDFYYMPVNTWQDFYQAVRDQTWPNADSIDKLPWELQQECRQVHGWGTSQVQGDAQYREIYQLVRNSGSPVKPSPHVSVNGSELTRIGRDLYFGTHTYHDDVEAIKQMAQREFPDYRNHVINTAGHADSTYCPVVPGLIVSLKDIPTYAETFPDWEVVYLEHQGWAQVQDFLELKQRNKGRWWIPGFERDTEVINVVETWFDKWVGYVEETVFDINMLTIDPKNVIVFGYNEKVFRAFNAHGITPHVVPFRHRYFWDGGIHCITLDLARSGSQQDFFTDNRTT